MVGKTVKHYRIIEKLGSGGMGDVYVADNLHLKNRAALKFLPPHLSRDEDAKRRFIQEAQSASALNHPNVCTIYDIDEADDGQLFMAMALYEGQTLKDRLEYDALPVNEAVDIAKQVAEGLGAAHEKGIIHRDIKPANIFITKRGRAVILDFGLAKLQESTAILTESGSTLGTAAYMSPEQARGEAVDHRSDIWSLGVVLYEMLAGERPFKAEYQQALVYQILNEEPTSIHILVPDLSEDVVKAIRSALSKDLGARTDGVPEFRSLLDGSPISPARRTADRRVSSRPLVIGGIVIVVISILIGIRFSMNDAAETPKLPSAFVVLPFTVEGDDELGYLRQGMVSLLSAKLDGFRELRSVDPNAVASQIVGTPDKPRFTIDDGVALSSRFGASGFVLGSVVRVSTSTHLDASLYDSQGKLEARSDVLIETDSLLTEAVDLLSMQLLSGRLETTGIQIPSLAAQTTESYKALQHFMEGEAAFQQRDYRMAFEAFDRATDEDSTFALAWYRKYLSASWGPVWEHRQQMRESLEHAKLHRGRLPGNSRLLIEAADYISDCRSDQARVVLTPLADREPENAWVWNLLGELAWHCNANDGRLATAAKPLLTKALELGGGFEEARLHLVDIAVEERNFQRAESLDVLTGTHEQWGPSPLLKLVNATSPERRRVVADSIVTSNSRFRRLWLHYELLRRFQMPRLAETFQEYIDSEDEWEKKHFASFRQVMLGRIAQYVSDESYYSFYAWTSLLYYPASQDELRVYRVRLDADTVERRVTPWREAFGVPAVSRDLHRGLVAWRVGDLGNLARISGTLLAMPDTSIVGRRGRVLGHVLAALKAQSEGNLEEALASLRRSRRPSRITEYGWDQELARFVRAELLFRDAQYQEALRWFRSAMSGNPWRTRISITAPSLFRLGQCHDQLGNSEEAIGYYTRFIDLWQDADERLQPWVQEARESMDRLVEEQATEPS